VTTRLLWLGLAGALGAVARYSLSGMVHRFSGTAFPWGTLLVNTLGCLLFGVIWSLAEAKAVLTAEARIAILVGFMGSFTTFSTLVFETAQMWFGSLWLLGIANLLGQAAVGLIALMAGMALGRLV